MDALDARRPTRSMLGAARRLGPRVATLGDGREVRAAGRVGAYSSRLLVERIQVHRLVDSLPDATASLLGCGISTAMGAVTVIAEVQPGQSVAIVGLGHLGQWCVQAARLAGAGRIIAIDPNPAKARARDGALGATDVVDAGRVDPVEAVRELTDGRGADVVLEAAGPDLATRQAVLMARRAGTIVLMGVAHSATDGAAAAAAAHGVRQTDHRLPERADHAGRRLPEVDRDARARRARRLADHHARVPARRDRHPALRRSMAGDDLSGVFNEFLALSFRPTWAP